MKEFTLILKDQEYTNTAKDWYESAHKFMERIDLDFKTIVDNMICDGVVKETTVQRLEREWK
jgi:hypothetical protein